jgi:limonene 1,2-monooxygenase
VPSSYLQFGLFIAPIQHPQQNPTRAIHRHLENIQLLERLGFDEVWVGEHHSGGYELIGSNELFIAVAAERTKRIRFGTGVISLPYHHPFMVAERAVLLDHLTMGRVTLGVGPGSLPHDATMLGIRMADTRRMMEESLEVIHQLLTTDEPVTRKTDWFTLVDAQLQLKPFSQPRLPLAFTAMESPFGPTLAGKYGAGLISLGATSPAGFAGLASHWGVVEEQAARHGNVADRGDWRVVGMLHLAETREQARKEVQYGYPRFMHYTTYVAGRKPAYIGTPEKPPETLDEIIDFMNSHYYACIGTPDDAVEFINHLLEKSGGFGRLLLFAHDWANPEGTARSFELLSREVMPVFQHSMKPLIRSMEASMAMQEFALREQRESIVAAQEKYLKENLATSVSLDPPSAPDTSGQEGPVG